jgi:hypothetical protein
MVTAEPELAVSPPVIEPELPPPSPVEINLEPVAFDAPPAAEALPQLLFHKPSSEEIDISTRRHD